MTEIILKQFRLYDGVFSVHTLDVFLPSYHHSGELLGTRFVPTSSKNKKQFRTNYLLFSASFYGNSYISIPLKEAKGSTDISFKFRTHLSNALILLVAGATDYCIVRLDNARLKLNINLGSGEFELASPFNTPLNDFEWHQVSILRKEANLSFVIDNITTIK